MIFCALSRVETSFTPTKTTTTTTVAALKKKENCYSGGTVGLRSGEAYIDRQVLCPIVVFVNSNIAIHMQQKRPPTPPS